MKKAFLLFLVLILTCVTITGCKDSSNNTSSSSGANNSSNTITSSSSKNANVGMIRDLSVDLERKYSIQDSDSNVLEVVSKADEVYQNDLNELISVSDDVIRGKVQNVAYTSYEGVAWTKSDVLITDTFKGNLKKGDVLSVFTLGGYIPLSEHIKGHNDAFRFKDLSAKKIKTTFLKETIDGEKPIKKSDDLILCVVKTPKDSPLPKGAYERVSYDDIKKMTE